MSRTASKPEGIRTWPLLMLGRAAVRLVACTLASLLLSACGPEAWKWQEEALLDDGRSIMVQREVIFSGPRLPWESKRGQSEWVLRFHDPADSNRRLEYRSPGGLSPAAIFFIKGQAHVIGNTWRGDAVTYYDCPSPPYVVHRYQDGRWRRVEFAVVPRSVERLNLALFSYEAAKSAEEGRAASAIQVQAWNKALADRRKQEHLSRIVRPRNDQLVFDCPAVGETTLDEDYKIEFRKRMPKGID